MYIEALWRQQAAQDEDWGGLPASGSFPFIRRKAYSIELDYFVLYHPDPLLRSPSGIIEILHFARLVSRLATTCHQFIHYDITYPISQAA